MEAHPRVAGLEDPGSAQLLHSRGVDLAQRAVPPRRVHRAMVGAPVLIGAVLDLIRRGTGQRGGGRQQGGQGKKHHHLRQLERVVVTPVCHRVLRPVVGESTWFRPSIRGTGRASEARTAPAICVATDDPNRVFYRSKPPASLPVAAKAREAEKPYAYLRGLSRRGWSRPRMGIAASCAGESSSQRVPFGFRHPRRVRITRSGVAIRSSGTSWSVIGRGSSKIWSSWTVVATGVSSPTAPTSRARANSRSLQPPPLPTRAPSGLTATLPTTTRSSFPSDFGRTGSPSLAAPAIVAASASLRPSFAGSRRRKQRSSRSRGTAMKTVLPARSAWSLTGRWAASGLHLRRFAPFHSGVSASLSAASSAPAKFGMRSWSGSGKRATRRAVRSAQTCSRSSPLSLTRARPPSVRPREELGERQRIDDLRGADPGAPGDAEAQLEVVEVGEPVRVARDRDRHAELRRPPRVGVVEVEALGRRVDLDRLTVRAGRLEHGVEVHVVRLARADQAPGPGGADGYGRG